MIKIQDPQIVEKMFSDEEFKSLQNIFSDHKKFYFDEWFSRYTISDDFLPEFKIYVDLATPIARKIFNSETLMPTYSLFATMKV
jgi:hypothetical protein